MIDDIGRLASGFDWLRPALCLIQDILRGGVHLAVRGLPGGPKRREVRRVLKQKGIGSWGLLYSPNLEFLMLSVREEHARAAYRVLEAAGIAVLGAPSWVTQQELRKRPRGGLVGRFFGAVDL